MERRLQAVSLVAALDEAQTRALRGLLVNTSARAVEGALRLLEDHCGVLPASLDLEEPLWRSELLRAVTERLVRHDGPNSDDEEDEDDDSSTVMMPDYTRFAVDMREHPDDDRADDDWS